MAPAAIRPLGLTKHFGRVIALDRLDLDVSAEEVFGFLGFARGGHAHDHPPNARAHPAHGRSNEFVDDPLRRADAGVVSRVSTPR